MKSQTEAMECYIGFLLGSKYEMQRAKGKMYNCNTLNVHVLGM